MLEIMLGRFMLTPLGCWLAMPLGAFYRELVPLIELGSHQPLVLTLALLGRTKGNIEGGGHFKKPFSFYGFGK